MSLSPPLALAGGDITAIDPDGPIPPHHQKVTYTNKETGQKVILYEAKCDPRVDMSLVAPHANPLTPGEYELADLTLLLRDRYLGLPREHKLMELWAYHELEKTTKQWRFNNAARGHGPSFRAMDVECPLPRRANAAKRRAARLEALWKFDMTVLGATEYAPTNGKTYGDNGMSWEEFVGAAHITFEAFEELKEKKKKEKKAKKKANRKKKYATSPPGSGSDNDGVNQDKLDAHHAAETAKHKAESEARRKVREAAEVAAAAKTEKPLSAPGPSGPVREARAPDEPLPLDERAREEVRKHDSIEKSKEHKESLKAREAARVAQLEEKKEKRGIGWAIQTGQAGGYGE